MLIASHSKKSLLLNGIHLPDRQLPEEQTVASAHVALRHTRTEGGIRIRLSDSFFKW